MDCLDNKKPHLNGALFLPLRPQRGTMEEIMFSNLNHELH